MWLVLYGSIVTGIVAFFVYALLSLGKASEQAIRDDEDDRMR